MAEQPSKRLRFRIFTQDEQCLDEALKDTSHGSKSDVIRAALVFLDQAWAGRNSGFQVLFRNAASGKTLNALDAIAPRVRHADAEGTVDGERAKTDRSIEIRVTRGDEERIHRLIKSGAADTYSELIRRAIRLYMAAVQRSLAGDEVVALSPSGDLLPVSVSGMGSVAYPAPGGQPRIAAPVSRGMASLLALLPRTLANDVARLADMEQCAADVLVIDLVRSETFARLNPETRRVPPPAEASLPEPMSVAPVAIPVVEAVPVVEVVPVVEAVSEPVDDHHAEAVQEIARTLDCMADNIEKIMQIIGTTARGKSQQADFTDLLFGANAEETEEEAHAESLSDIERLSQRAHELNDRLATLLSLSQRERKQRTSRPAKAAPDTEPA